MDPRFHKYLYMIAICALIIAVLTIYKGLNEINLFLLKELKFDNF